MIDLLARLKAILAASPASCAECGKLLEPLEAISTPLLPGRKYCEGGDCIKIARLRRRWRLLQRPP